MKDLRSTKGNKAMRNYMVIVAALGVVVLGILWSIFNTAFIEKDFWMAVAEKQQRPNRQVLARRGNIYSADGKLMATSAPKFYLYMDFKTNGFDPEVFNRNLDSLSLLLSQKLKDKSPAGYKAHLQKGYRSKSRQFPLYRNKVSYSDYKAIKKFPFLRYHAFKSGFYVKEMVQRQRPFNSLAARTIGDIYGEIESTGDSRGKNGLELQYDSLLRGVSGMNSVRRVGTGWTNVVEVEPIDGMDIITTIDIQMQDITEKSLLDKLMEIDAESGTAVLMEVETGEIKAITNMGRLREGVYAETKNYAVADEIEPGSTFKVASMMVALDDGIVLPTDTIDVGNGIYMYKGARMTDHNAHKGGYKRISAEEAIWYSSNIGVAKVILKGYERNPGKFVDGLYRIGLNKRLDLEIPGSGRSKIRHPKDSLARWSKTALPWMSFGYETQIPPIYTLTFFNAIANNGRMLHPIFTKEIQNDGDVVQRFSTTEMNPSICKQQTLKTIQEMLIGVVEHGTGKAVYSDVVQIAGKTGTAQISQGVLGYKAGGKSHQVTFCGYFPADKPKYSCIVVVRKPRKGYPSGGGMSGVVFKNIAEKVYSNSLTINLSDMKPDSLAQKIPLAKGGDWSSLASVLDELNVDYDDDSIATNWVLPKYTVDAEKLDLNDITVRKGFVPKAIGLGAKDAVYLMEQAGLRVRLTGMGRVVSQSLPIGRKVVPGHTVSLVLK